MKRPESVLVAIYTERGDVLLLRRRDVSEFWQSVTGSLEWHESAEEAAARELFEETGLTARPVDLGQSTVFEIKPPWRERYSAEVTHNREHRFSVCLPRRQPIVLCDDEHVEYQWLAAEQAALLASSSTNRELIRDLLLVR